MQHIPNSVQWEEIRNSPTRGKCTNYDTINNFPEAQCLIKLGLFCW